MIGRRALLAGALGGVATVATTRDAWSESWRTAPKPPTLLTSSRWRTATVADFDDLGVGTAIPINTWLARGAVPGRGTRWEPMVSWALVDLKMLLKSTGAFSAGAAPHWNYAWPRDTAFAIAAMSRTGHRREALQMLRFLQRTQRPDGGYEARDRLTGGPPDTRPPQADGAGWVLWAMSQTIGDVATNTAAIDLHPFRSTTDRAVAFIEARLHGAGDLPIHSPDYWERPETEVTLELCAALLMGLRSASHLYVGFGDKHRSARCSQLADRLEQRIHRTFVAHRYQRYRRHGGVDAGVCFMMPPFTNQAEQEVVRAWERYQHDARRTAGGLTPGAHWRRDGVSWTPETALVAYTAAVAGRTDVAAHWLDWLDKHRAPWGSLPEKVRDDGRPAGPAPLGWTAASVVLAAHRLHPDKGGDPVTRS